MRWNEPLMLLLRKQIQGVLDVPVIIDDAVWSQCILQGRGSDESKVDHGIVESLGYFLQTLCVGVITHPDASPVYYEFDIKSSRNKSCKMKSITLKVVINEEESKKEFISVMLPDESS